MTDDNEPTEILIFDTPQAIESFRRATMRVALKFNIAHGFWPAGPKSNPLAIIRKSYGWKGRTSKQALRFMEELGDS